MIKHILKQMWVERRHNIWLLLELIVVVFFLLISIDFMWIKLKNYYEPTGFDIENTYLLKLKELNPIAPDYVNPELIETTPTEELMTLVRQIEQYPDVEVVSLSYYASPYASGGFYDVLRIDTTSTTQGIQGFKVMPSYFDVFRIKTLDGNPVKTEMKGHRQLILSENLAEMLFDNTIGIIGKDIYGGQGYNSDGEELPAKIIGISSKIKRQEFNPYEPVFFEILSPSQLENMIHNAGITRANICVRIRPGSKTHFEEHFESDMGELLRVNNLYVSSVVSSDKLRDNIVGVVLRQSVRLMIYVIIFVLIMVFLGIFGAFWLRSRQRLGETGIRMAVGARRQTVLRYTTTEGLCLLIIALIPALIVYINLLHADLLDTWRLPYTAGRVVLVTLVSLLITIIMILSGISWPAKKASAIQLADALRDE